MQSKTFTTGLKFTAKVFLCKNISILNRKCSIKRHQVTPLNFSFKNWAKLPLKQIQITEKSGFDKHLYTTSWYNRGVLLSNAQGQSHSCSLHKRQVHGAPLSSVSPLLFGHPTGQKSFLLDTIKHTTRACLHAESEFCFLSSSFDFQDREHQSLQTYVAFCYELIHTGCRCSWASDFLFLRTSTPAIPSWLSLHTLTQYGFNKNRMLHHTLIRAVLSALKANGYSKDIFVGWASLQV